MANVTMQGIVTNPSAATVYSSASGGGDTITPVVGSFITVKNGSGASITVTLVTPAFVDADLPVGDRAVAVAAGAEKDIATPPSLYRDPATGLASITWSATATVTFAHKGI
jgi:hypothetical protein